MREPNWWESLTPLGQIVVASLITICFVVLMILVGTLQTWGQS